MVKKSINLEVEPSTIKELYEDEVISLDKAKKALEQFSKEDFINDYLDLNEDKETEVIDTEVEVVDEEPKKIKDEKVKESIDDDDIDLDLDL